MDLSSSHIAIIGSCVSRDPFELVERQPVFPIYLARQTLAGFGDRGLKVDEAWFDGVNPFEQRCAFHDLRKSWGSLDWTKRIDALVIDYVDERFDILDIAGTHVSDTAHMRRPGLIAHYGDQIMRIPRRSSEGEHLWRIGARAFFDWLRERIDPKRIILHEASWASAEREPDGTVRPLPEPYAALVPPNNAMLDQYHAFTRSLVPEAKIIRVPREAVFSDPNHRWSREPFHYTEAYYREFLAQLTKILG